MSAPSEEGLLGRIALHYKLLTQEQLNQAVARHKAGTPGKRIGEVLLELKFITKEQLDWLLNAQMQYLAKQKQGSGPAPAATAPAEAKPAEVKPAEVKSAAAPVPDEPVHHVGPKRPAQAMVFDDEAARQKRAKLPSLKQILAKAMEAKASDVHVHSGASLQMRVGGTLRELKTGVLDAQAVEFVLKDALTDEQRHQLDTTWELDAALVLPEVGRFRASFYKQQRGWDAVFRPIPPDPPTLASLGLPKVLERLTEFHQGLVLVTGPAGSGKSSTLAALVSLLNATRTDHIITVEDPIEYVHTPKGCVVNQRQAGRHTKSFANALRAALREDPDVIVIGELRDLETIQLAITAAETGHLVMGTLHTNNAIRTINRVLDVFPPKQQSQIRAMVSESLRGIVSQRLIPSADGTKRVAAMEALFVKPSVSNLIREEKTFQIRSIMQTAKSEGMCLLDDSIFELMKSGQITKEVARRYAEDPKRFA